MGNLNDLSMLSEECQDYLKRIAEIEDSPHLNSWEEEFIENMKKQVLDNRTLFGGQVEKFDQVEDVAVNGREW